VRNTTSAVKQTNEAIVKNKGAAFANVSKAGSG